ncbi:DNA methyltransferase [Micromonospora sp. DT4]|uniref:DNA methyltransferase n=1 Tax=Micromonospora sp. DT4 TaxID=3393438 RepID=UPI003CF57151
MDAYLDRLVAVFAQVARVLTPAGTVWLNLGDAYTSTRRHLPAARTTPSSGRQAPRAQVKQLLGVPWRAAIALQDDGWIMRNAIVWAKTNPMPSSVRDRLTTTYSAPPPRVSLPKSGGAGCGCTWAAAHRSDRLSLLQRNDLGLRPRPAPAAAAALASRVTPPLTPLEHHHARYP